jgi:hypothetical protein
MTLTARAPPFLMLLCVGGCPQWTTNLKLPVALSGITMRSLRQITDNMPGRTVASKPAPDSHGAGHHSGISTALDQLPSLCEGSQTLARLAADAFQHNTSERVAMTTTIMQMMSAYSASINTDRELLAE